MLEYLILAGSTMYSNPKYIFPLLCLIIYIIYYKKFRYYIFRQKKTFTKGKHRLGKTLPTYPNGWYVVMRSEELQKGETKYVDTHGEGLVVFRGTNGQVYALSAYCAHLGANLGINGKVVNQRCVQCPFHAWVFDGETGNCVIGKDMKVKEGISYEYQFEEKPHDETKCDFWSSNKTEKIKIKKFVSKEVSGYIYVWFSASKHVKNELGEDDPTKIPYQPLDISDFQKRLDKRGYSLNIVNTHPSDIAENGGDVLHFLYIHSEIIPYLIKGFWDANWIRGDDPQLREKMRHPDKEFDEYRTNLFDRYLDEKNAKHIGVIHLENQITILGLPKRFNFFFLTAFQVGPGIVYLFIKSKFFETVLVQFTDSKEKYLQYVYHDIYSTWASPYWFTALQLRLEAQQVLNDGVVWDNKKFGYKAYFGKNEQDNILIKWRTWFTQFYDGCQEAEKEKDKINW